MEKCREKVRYLEGQCRRPKVQLIKAIGKEQKRWKERNYRIHNKKQISKSGKLKLEIKSSWMPSKMNEYLQWGLLLGNYRTLRQKEYPKHFYKEKTVCWKKEWHIFSQ